MSTPSRTRQYRRQDAIKRKYGLSWEEYILLYEKCNGLCEICEKPLSLLLDEEKQTAFVDHCHTTGKVRGLLCLKCNMGLGAFNDSRLHLGKALDYLDKYDVDC